MPDLRQLTRPDKMTRLGWQTSLPQTSLAWPGQHCHAAPAGTADLLIGRAHGKPPADRPVGSQGRPRQNAVRRSLRFPVGEEAWNNDGGRLMTRPVDHYR